MGEIAINPKRYIIPILVGLIAVLAALTACQGATAAPTPTSIPATPRPTATARPELPTPAPVGSDVNPIEIVIGAPNATGSQSDADTLASTMSDQAGAIFTVQLTDTYSEAFQALCHGTASAVMVNAMGTLAAQDLNCGEPLYVAEVDGETVTQGEIISSLYFGTNLANLNGAVFCRPDAESVNRWFLPMLVIQDLGLDPYTDLFRIIDTGSDDATFELIDSNECQLGAVQAGAEQSLTNPDSLNVLQVLPQVPNDLIVVSTQLDESARALVEEALRRNLDGIASLVGVDSLTEADPETFTDLSALLDTSGVDLAALGQ